MRHRLSVVIMLLVLTGVGTYAQKETDSMLALGYSYSDLIGIAGRVEDVGEDHAISIPELMALADEKGVQYPNIFGQDVRSTIFFSALQLNGPEFIDVAAGEASFDSPEFEAILKLAAEFPEEMDYSEEGDMEDTSDWYRSGRSLLQERYFSSFDEFNNAEP